jgi:hypothetical protein
VKLGDFFKSAPYACPVNPKPVSLVAICKDLDVLPSAQPNTSKKQVRAKVDCCLVFIGAKGVAEARAAARKYVAEQTLDSKAKILLPMDDEAVWRETQKQMLWRALREYDAKEQLSGDEQFPTVDLLREMVEQSECNRLMDAYDAYVKEEHPEVPNQGTFRETED